MIACSPPDTGLGVAVRLAGYLDCQARALGENGFQAFIGGPAMASLLSGLVTIFVALIGYRLILGRTPDLRDGVGWAVRLGVVLALVTGWPAFQTLVYRVAVDGPVELAADLMPASGLPSDGLEVRVQAAYDTMRLGWSSEPSAQASSQSGGEQDELATSVPSASPDPRLGIGQAPLPQTASLFVMSTVGMAGAFRMGVGFLLAVGPLAILALLFDGTLGLFSGWVRALGGTSLATLAATLVTAVHLVVVEGELAAAQTYAQGGVVGSVDAQALTTIVFSFLAVALAAVFAALRMASALTLTASPELRMPATERLAGGAFAVAQAPPAFAVQQGRTGFAASSEQTRMATVVDALSASVRREQAALATGGPGQVARSMTIVQATARTEPGGSVVPLGVAGRRSAGRQTRSARARDSVT
jgi:type IV secretion system protein VirB6